MRSSWARRSALPPSSSESPSEADPSPPPSEGRSLPPSRYAIPLPALARMRLIPSALLLCPRLERCRASSACPPYALLPSMGRRNPLHSDGATLRPAMTGALRITSFGGGRDIPPGPRDPRDPGRHSWEGVVDKGLVDKGLVDKGSVEEALVEEALVEEDAEAPAARAARPMGLSCRALPAPPTPRPTPHGAGAAPPGGERILRPSGPKLDGLFFPASIGRERRRRRRRRRRVTWEGRGRRVRSPPSFSFFFFCLFCSHSACGAFWLLAVVSSFLEGCITL